MVAGAIAGNISAEATTSTGNGFAEAMRASNKRMLSQVYGAAFLLRFAKARGRNLRSPRIT